MLNGHLRGDLNYVPLGEPHVQIPDRLLHEMHRSRIPYCPLPNSPLMMSS